jgi:hypothetical protein
MLAAIATKADGSGWKTSNRNFPASTETINLKHLGYAKHLIEKDGKFVEHKHYLNSHGGQPDYREMIELWQSWGSPAKLTKTQTDELLAVR